MTDVEKAILAARHFETLLRDRYRARGTGLGQKTRSVSRNLHKDTIDNLLYIAEVRNKVAHEKVDKLPDKQRFETACAALESFFKEALFTESEPVASWTEALQIGVWPKSVESSLQKRLYTLSPGSIRIYPIGIHRVSTLRNTTEAGFIWMMPQSLPQIEIGTLQSQDGLALSMTVEVSVAVADSESTIKAVILDDAQQTDTLKRQLLLVLQRISSTKTYDQLSKTVHEIADQLKADVNKKALSDRSGAYIVMDCAVVDCSLEDSEIQEMRRHALRANEEARRSAEEHRHIVELEQRQAESQREKAELERRFASESRLHRLEMEKLESDAKARENRLQQQLQKEKELLELEVAVAKADLAASSAGTRVLYPDESFGLDRLRLNRDAEFWKANFSDKKMQNMMDLLISAGANQADVQWLKNMAATMNMSSVAVTERPLALHDGSTSMTTTPPAGQSESDDEGDSAVRK